MSRELSFSEANSESIDEDPLKAANLDLGGESVQKNQVLKYLEKIGRIAVFEAADEVSAGKDIEAGLLAVSILGDNAQYNIGLPNNEVAELCDMQDRGLLSRNQLIEANLRLVFALARRYKNSNANQYNVSLWDLIQEGNLALVEASEKFDYAKGLKFSTYATKCINGAMKKYLKGDRPVSMSPSTADKLNLIHNAADELYLATSRHATTEEIAAELKWKPSTVRHIMFGGSIPLYLDRELDSDTTLTYSDVISDNPDPVWAELEETMMSEEVQATLEELSFEDRQFIADKYGLDDEDSKGMTNKELAKKYGMSQRMAEQRSANLRKVLQESVHADLLVDLLH